MRLKATKTQLIKAIISSFGVVLYGILYTYTTVLFAYSEMWSAMIVYGIVPFISVIYMIYKWGLAGENNG